MTPVVARPFSVRLDWRLGLVPAEMASVVALIVGFGWSDDFNGAIGMDREGKSPAVKFGLADLSSVWI
ncbi:hypothetical protein AKJ16_DCAP01919 [Drosera capensis]